MGHRWALPSPLYASPSPSTEKGWPKQGNSSLCKKIPEKFLNQNQKVFFLFPSLFLFQNQKGKIILSIFM
jgi:hypothetical protein